MIRRDIIICIGSLVFLVGFSLYSYNGYQNVLQTEPLELLKKECMPSVQKDVLSTVSVESLNKEITLSQFSSVRRRNPFERVTEMVRKTMPVKLTLPKPTIEPRKVEPPPEKPEERYIYRGKVVLGDSIKYVIERERDKKTYFVNKDDRTRDFIVLETSDKQVVISDKEDTIKVLKVLK